MRSPLTSLGLLFAFLHYVVCVVDTNITTDYDVLVIGGGPAGLATTSSLVRVGWRALMLDSGTYRNIATRHAHDVIGNDGTAPWYFRQVARQQISAYPTATMKNGTITSIQNIKNGTYFIATDMNNQTYTGRKVVLASGILDVLPDAGNLRQLFGKGVFWCPWCDGYEHRGQPIGFLGPLDKGLTKVLDLPNLYSDIVIYANGSQTDTLVATLNASYPGWQDALAAYNIPIDNRSVISVDRLNVSGPAGTNQSADGSYYDPTTHEEYDSFEITFADGSTANRSAIIGTWPTVIQSPYLATQLGVGLYSGRLDGNSTSTMQTNVTGVWAVGDANADLSTNVYHAFYSGKAAAINIHGVLMKEDTAYLITLKDGEAAGDEVASQNSTNFKRSEKTKVTISMKDMEQLLKRDNSMEDLWEQAVVESNARRRV